MFFPMSVAIPIIGTHARHFFPKQTLQVDITYGSAVAIYQYMYRQHTVWESKQEGLHQNLLSLQLCKLTVGSSQSPTIFIVNGKAAAHSGTPIVHVQTINGHSICPTQTDFLSLNFSAIYVYKYQIVLSLHSLSMSRKDSVKRPTYVCISVLFYSTFFI